VFLFQSSRNRGKREGGGGEKEGQRRRITTSLTSFFFIHGAGNQEEGKGGGRFKKRGRLLFALRYWHRTEGEFESEREEGEKILCGNRVRRPSPQSFPLATNGR